MKRKILIVFLIFCFVLPQKAMAVGIPVFDLSKWLQDLYEYILEGWRFTQEMYKLVEEINLLSQQKEKLEDLKKFTDDFMELYKSTLEILNGSRLNNMISSSSSFSYDSPFVYNIVKDLSGEEASNYQRFIDGEAELHNISELRENFSRVYWNLENVKAKIEEAFPDNTSDDKKFLLKEANRLGMIEARKIASDASISRIKASIREYLNDIIPENERILKEAADNLIKINQAQAAGTINLQKMQAQQLILLARNVELLSELLAEKGYEKIAAIRKIIEEQKIKGTYGKKRNEYASDVGNVVNGTSKSLLKGIVSSIGEEDEQ